MIKNSLKYIKNILKTLIWPILFVIGQILIEYIFVAIFNSKEKGTMTNDAFLNYIKTIEYQDKLKNYMSSRVLIILLITTLIFIPLLYKAFKKYKTKNNFKLKDIFIPILFGISISLIYNILVFSLNNVTHFTDNFEPSYLPIVLQLLCTGILGPIFEELIFRGIVYNKLKTFNKPMRSIILCSVIFAFFHTDIVNAIYAFGVSFILIYLYEKYKTLKAPIIMHIALNTTTILMVNLIVKNYLSFNIYLLVVSLIILINLRKFIKIDV